MCQLKVYTNKWASANTDKYFTFQVYILSNSKIKIHRAKQMLPAVSLFSQVINNSGFIIYMLPGRNNKSEKIKIRNKK